MSTFNKHMMDVYCERVGPGLLAEPLNAISNVSFIVAALAIWFVSRGSLDRSRDTKILMMLSISVGVGSFLWHTWANSWTLILDVAPIFLFATWFIWVYMRSTVKDSTRHSAAAVVSFILLTLIGLQFSYVLHGMLVYLPTFLALLALALLQRSGAKGLTLVLGASVYSVALFLRTIDNEVCDVFPIGTHFLWHALSGLTAYIVMHSTLKSHPRLA